MIDELYRLYDHVWYQAWTLIYNHFGLYALLNVAVLVFLVILARRNYVRSH